MGNLFNCKDHFYFYTYIHISKKKNCLGQDSIPDQALIFQVLVQPLR